MRRLLVMMLAVLSAISVGASVPAAAASDDRAAMQGALAAVVAAGAAGVQVRVHDRTGDWVATAGVARLDSPGGVPSDGRFRAGSITKTFVATVVLQLVGEGRLRLDDPVARYLPQYRLDPHITVRMLLNHTSGLFNYTGDYRRNGRFVPGIVHGDPMRVYTPDELVRFALAQPARFAPGRKWSYSNTNYVLAGLLIEKITGMPYGLAVYRHIIVPLGLWSTSLPGRWPYLLGPHADGYAEDTRAGTTTLVDFANQNPSWIWAAGEIVSTTRDLDTFLAALLGGRLLAPPLLAQMRRFVVADPDARYGLGLSRIGFRANCFGTGHDGILPGYNSFMFGTDDGRRLEMSVTEGRRGHNDPAVLTAEFRAVTVGLCGS